MWGTSIRAFTISMRTKIPALLAAGMMVGIAPAHSDSTGPRLGAYYDEFVALCDGAVLEWRAGEPPRRTISGVRQVGIGKRMRYGLRDDGALLAWNENPAQALKLMDDVRQFHAGFTALLVIRSDGSLWHIDIRQLPLIGEIGFDDPRLLANDVVTASVGDGANYYVNREGTLFVHGRAHRGQYGDGRLESTDGYVPTAEDVRVVVSHTGHALHLKQDGSVWGTGGNIYGPLASHGFGDKATRWGKLMDDVAAIATGASHSLAIRSDGSLWTWGRDEGLAPTRLLENVGEAAAGTDHSAALADGALWFWRRGERPVRIQACPD